MSSIDNRIVQMQFDNSQFEKGVRQSMKSIDELEDSLQFKKAEKGLANLQKAGDSFSLARMADGIEAIEAKFSALGVIGKRVLENLTDSAMRMGENFVKSVSVDQISAGFGKYEMKTKSVKTIMEATGKDVESVNAQLERLNWFTDETSYNYGDMVDNISKFTSMGIDLDTSVTAMQGIATWAALSGQGVQEASRAMYNLSQSIGVGSVKLIDWKSIENANMATKEFKQTAIETAKAMGVLNKQGKTSKGTLVTFENFSQTLNEGWFNKEVLIKTLDEYGSAANQIYEYATEKGIPASRAIKELGLNMEDLGVRAFLAAQEARTFKDSIDATKDAVSTGWMKTFEHVFGNVDQATELWTEFTEVLYELFAISGEHRNELLAEWSSKEVGGRADLVKGFMDALWGLVAVINTVKDAFFEIFPPITVEMLQNLTLGVKEFGANIRAAFEPVEILTDEFEELTRVIPANPFEPFEKSFKRGANGPEIKALQERLMSLGYELPNFGADGIFGPETQAALEKFQRDAGLTVDGIYDEATHKALGKALGFNDEDTTVIEKVRKKIESLPPTAQKVKRLLEGAFAVFKIGARVFSFLWGVIKRVADALSPIGDMFLTIADAAARFFIALNNRLSKSERFQQWLDKINNLLTPVKEKIASLCQSFLDLLGIGGDLNQIDFDQVVENFINSIKSFFGMNVDVSSIGDGIDTQSAIESIKSKIIEIYTGVRDWIINLLNKIGGNGEGEGGIPKIDFSKYNLAMTGIMIVVGLLSSKLLAAIGQIVKAGRNVNKILKNIRGITSKLRNESVFKGMGQVADALLKFAFAIGVIAASIWLLSRLSWDQLAVGLVGLGAILIVLVGAVFLMKKAADKFKNIETVMGALLQFSFALMAMGVVVMMLSQLSWEQIGKGLVGIAGLLALALVAIHFLNKEKVDVKSVSGTIGLIGTLAATLGNFANVIQKLGSMNTNVLIKGFIALAAVMVAIALFMKAVSKVKIEWSAVAGLVAAAVAINLAIAGFLIMTLAMKIFSPTDIIKGIVGMVAVVLVIGLLLKMVNKINPSPSAILALLPAAIAIDLVALAFIGMMFALKNASITDLLKGIAGMAIVIIAIGALLKKASKTKPNIRAILALIPVAIAIDLVVLGFTALLLTMKHMSWSDLVKGLVGMAVVVIAIAALTKAMQKSKPSLRGILALIPVALAMDIAIAGFIVLCLAMKSISWGDMLKAIVAFAAIIIGMKVVTSALQNTTSLKGALTMMISMIAMVGAMVAFALVLKYIKDVETKKIVAFAAGLSVIMLAFGGLALMSKAAGIGGILTAAGAIIAISAAIGLVIAAFAALSKIPGFQDFMNSGASSIGQIIGTIVEEIEAAKFKGMAKGMQALSSADYDIDKDKLDSILECAQAFSDFNSNLPDRPLVEKLIPWAKTNMELTMSDMVAFGQGITKFTESIKQFNTDDYDSDKVSVAEQMVSDFATFNENLPQESFADRLVTWVTGQSNLENQLSDMESFAKGIGKFALYMPLVVAGVDSYDSESMNLAMEIVKGFADFNTSLPAADNVTRLVDWVTGHSNLEEQLSGMETFAKGMCNFALYMPLVTAGLTSYKQDDMDLAMSIVKGFADFNTSLPAANNVTRLVDWVTGHTNLEEQLSGMETFAKGMLNFAMYMPLVSSGLSNYDDANMQLAMSIVKGFADFNTSLPAADNVTRLVDWVTGHSNLDTQLKDMDSFATGMAKFADGMPKIVQASTNYDDASMKKAIGIVTDFANFSVGLPTASIGERLLQWIGIGSSLDNTMTDMDSFASGFNKFAEAMSGITWSEELETDTGNAIKIATQVANFLAELKKLDIDKKSGAVKAWFSDETAQDTLFDSIATLAESIKNNQSSFSGISEGTLVEDIKGAVKAAAAVAGLLNVISQDDFKITKDVDQGWDGYTSTFDILVANIKTIGEKIKEFSTEVEGIDLNAISNAMNSVTSFLSVLVNAPEGFTGDSILSFLNEDQITEKLANLVTTVSTQFQQAGIDLAGSLSTGISEGKITGIDVLMIKMLAEAENYKKSFATLGANYVAGLANGVLFNTRVAVGAARTVATKMINAVASVFNSHSPSRETEKYGNYFTEGLAIGTEDKIGQATNAASDVADSMLSTASTTLSSLSELLADDIDVNPVISPVVDLTNARASAAMIGGLFGNQTFGVNSQAMAMSAQASTFNGRPVTIQNGTINTSEAMANVNDKLNALNAALTTSNNQGPHVDPMESLSEKFGDLANAVTNLKIVLDSGVLVGEISGMMDSDLGTLAMRRERGN